MTRFVLVPGAGGMASFWHPVADRLAAAGHDPVPVDLPAEDDAAALPEYAQVVVDAAGPGPVVLVGQSLGGFTVPMAAQRLDVAAIVLLNAMVPLPGETPGTWFADAGSAPARVERAKAEGYPVEFDDDTYFFHDVSPDAVTGPERGQSDAVFGSPCAFDAWPDVPVTALAGIDDRLFTLDFQRRSVRERLGLDVVPVPGGHLAALAFPDEVTAAIIAAA
jgi:pimeloyl-ACP methyl ester carboxylesterase